MLALLWTTLGVSIASAFFPIVNIEAYLGVVASQVGAERALTIALVAAAGQSLGKIVWYEAGRRGAESRWLAQRLARPAVRARYDLLLERAHGRPWLAAGLLLAGSVVGLPPLLVAAPLAGALRMRRDVFLVVIWLGRTLQFWVILTGLGHLFA